MGVRGFFFLAESLTAKEGNMEIICACTDDRMTLLATEQGIVLYIRDLLFQRIPSWVAHDETAQLVGFILGTALVIEVGILTHLLLLLPSTTTM